MFHTGREMCQRKLLEMASDDLFELRDQIKSMMTTLRTIEEEKRCISKESQQYEEKCLLLKTEANILSALDTVRYHDHEVMNEMNDKKIFNKTFLETNLKLDLTILNLELRQNLPKYEKEIINKEYETENEMEVIQQLKLKKELFLIKNENQTQEEMTELLEKRMRMEGTSTLNDHTFN